MIRILLVVVATLLVSGCNQSRIDELEANVDDLQAELVAANSRISELEASNEELEEKLIAASDSLQSARSRARELDASIDSLDLTVSRFQFENWGYVVPALQTNVMTVDMDLDTLMSALDHAAYELE